jgi:Xaa-Pro aminopeptidase
VTVSTFSDSGAELSAAEILAQPAPPATGADERERRLARAREEMEKAGLDALFLTDRSNVYYFTSHRSAQYEHKMRPQGIVLPLVGNPAAVVYSRDLGAMRQSTGWEQVTSYIDVPYPVEMLADMLRAAGLDRAGARIGVELGDNERLALPISDLRKLERDFFPRAAFVDAAPLLRELKIRKSPLEIAYIRRACAISQVAWERTCERVRAGMSVRQVGTVLTIAMLELGADLTHPGKIAQAYAPDYVYQKGDALWCDYGAIFRGYNADIARRGIFGGPSDQQRREHELIWSITEACIAGVKPGARASDIARIANDRMIQAGYPGLNGPKRVGHSIGLEPSEPPSLSLVDDTVLEPGMVVTPEPRIDLSKTERLHIEEDILVSADAPDGHVWLSRGAQSLATIES